MAGKIGCDDGVGASEHRNQVAPGLPGPSKSVNEEQDPRSSSGRRVCEIATGERHSRFV